MVRIAETDIPAPRRGYPASTNPVGPSSRHVDRVGAADTMLRLIASISERMNASAGAIEDLESVAQQVVDATGFTLGHGYLLTHDGALKPTDSWVTRRGASVPEQFRAASAHAILPLGIGLPGHTTASAAPVWITDLAGAANFPRRDSAIAAGLTSAMAFPALVGSRVAAVLEFFSTNRREPDSMLIDVASVLGHIIGRGFERAEAQNEQAASRIHAQRILDNAGDAFIGIDDDGVVIGWNREAVDLFGFTADEAIGAVMADMIVPPEYRHDHTEGVRRFVRYGHGRIGGKYVELEALRRSGEKFPIEMAFWGVEQGGRWNFFSFARDISERRVREAELIYWTVHDDLTGLPNRAAAITHIRETLAARSERGDDVAVLFMDLDRFKITTERLGHFAADQLLKAVAGRLTKAVRSGDWVALVADDEFVVVCDDIADTETAVGIAQRIQASLREPIELSEDQVAIGASIGIVFAGSDSDTAENLLGDVSAGMSVARDQIRGGVKVFDAAMRHEVRGRLGVERDLASGIEKGQLRVYYQPVIDLATRSVVGVESLVRWQHPERGLLAPAEFIALAEESGLIVPLGTWVLRESCRQAAEWQRRGCRDLTVAVNLSARQFTQSRLVEMVSDIVHETGMEFDRVQLALEVTETLLMNDPDVTARTLTALRGKGVKLSLDDFGTGYSSLAYLKSFPVDTLKIDRSFVTNVATDSDDRAIVTAVTQLGHALNLEVLAEGIETEEQLACLQSVGCDLAQGYYFGRPMPAEQVTLLLLPGTVVTQGASHRCAIEAAVRCGCDP